MTLKFIVLWINTVWFHMFCSPFLNLDLLNVHMLLWQSEHTCAVLFLCLLRSLVTWFYASRCNDLWVGKTRRVDNVSGLKPRAVSAVCRWRMLWFNVERSSFAACWFCVYVVSVCLWMWIWFPFEIFNVFFTSGCLKNMEMSLSGSLQCNCWLVCIDPAK